MDYARRAFVLGVLAAVVGGCVTPQIPLPPPVIDKLGLEIVDDSRNLVRIVAEAGAVPDKSGVEVHILDPSTGCTEIADCRLTFKAEGATFNSPAFIASDGARLDIEYHATNGDSEPLCVIIDKTKPNNLAKCP
ncbi:MAG: hypothetical protein KC503_36230 [Myxococcales bacterium]|nr:hypothetical protein [Myxococcales bacterium]